MIGTVAIFVLMGGRDPTWMSIRISGVVVDAAGHLVRDARVALVPMVFLIALACIRPLYPGSSNLLANTTVA